MCIEILKYKKAKSNRGTISRPEMACHVVADQVLVTSWLQSAENPPRLLDYRPDVVERPMLIPTSTSTMILWWLSFSKSSSSWIRPFSNATMILDPPNWKSPISSPFFTWCPSRMCSWILSQRSANDVIHRTPKYILNGADVRCANGYKQNISKFLTFNTDTAPRILRHDINRTLQSHWIDLIIVARDRLEPLYRSCNGRVVPVIVLRTKTKASDCSILPPFCTIRVSD